MKTLTLLLTILLLASCGRGLDTRADQGEFRPYVEKFIAAAEARGFDVRNDADLVRIEYGQEGAEDPAGHCSKSIITGPTIYFKREIWDVVDDSSREILMMHELGHCVMGYEHTIAGGIMQKDLNTTVAHMYRDNPAMYLNQFFKLNEKVEKGERVWLD